MKQPAARERLRLVTVGEDPPTTGVTLPHLVLPPRSANGDPCVGFAFSLWPPTGGGAAVPELGGFTVRIYRLVTTLSAWASFAQFTGAQYGHQLLCYDVAAGTALRFAISNAQGDGGDPENFGSVVVAVAALS